MIDLDYLKKLVPILRASGCSHFKMEGLELKLEGSFHGPKSDIPAPPTLIPVDDSNLPPDLRGDDLFNYDKVLNWSGSPDSEAPMPLTGEESGAV